MQYLRLFVGVEGTGFWGVLVYHLPEPLQEFVYHVRPKLHSLHRDTLVRGMYKLPEVETVRQLHRSEAVGLYS